MVRTICLLISCSTLARAFGVLPRPHMTLRTVLSRPHDSFALRMAAPAAQPARNLYDVATVRIASLPLKVKIAAATFAAVLYLAVTILELLHLRRAERAQADCEVGDEESCARFEEMKARTPKWKLKLANLA